jgi:glycyl-tRNA synthetase
VAELERYQGEATIEKVAALSRRRGFVFPSSDIYGGLGSSYDYGHYGVLLKQNVKSAWQRALVQERDDVVLLDSAIILHPAVWVASGHVGGFSDPLIDCRTCKLRFRADHLADSACGRKPSRHPGETPDCDLTEPRQFNLMFETQIGPVRDEASRAYLRPETAQGIFINFKHVTSSLRVKPPFGIAQIGKSFRNEITPGNFLFRTREFEQMEMEFFVPSRPGGEMVRVLDRRAAPLVPGAGAAPEPPARPRARRRRALALLERHQRPRVPVPDRLVGAGRGGQPG